MSAFYIPCSEPILNNNQTVLSCRAEKDKAQFGAELNDLRAGVDHLSNEKVFLQKCSMWPK